MKQFIKDMFSSESGTSSKRVMAFAMMTAFIVFMFWKDADLVVDWLGMFFVMCVGGTVAEGMVSIFKKK